tara:strand:+ start:251 stop:559 length:309 start_codon:yes stop_codon:yes gene_type:complete
MNILHVVVPATAPELPLLPLEVVEVELLESAATASQLVFVVASVWKPAAQVTLSKKILELAFAYPSVAVTTIRSAPILFVALRVITELLTVQLTNDVLALHV